MVKDYLIDSSPYYRIKDYYSFRNDLPDYVLHHPEVLRGGYHNEDLFIPEWMLDSKEDTLFQEDEKLDTLPVGIKINLEETKDIE